MAPAPSKTQRAPVVSALVSSVATGVRSTRGRGRRLPQTDPRLVAVADLDPAPGDGRHPESLGGRVHRGAVQRRAAPTPPRPASGWVTSTRTIARSCSGRSSMLAHPSARARARRVEGVGLVRPQRPVALGVLDQRGQDPQRLGGGPRRAVHDVASRGGHAEHRARPARRRRGRRPRTPPARPGDRSPRRSRPPAPPRRGAARGRRPGPRHTAAPARSRRRRRSGRWRPLRRRRAAASRRARARRTIPAETSCHSSSGVGVPGQCDNVHTVPGRGAPSTMTWRRPAEEPGRDVAQRRSPGPRLSHPCRTGRRSAGRGRGRGG